MMAEVNYSQLSTKPTGWTIGLSYYLDVEENIRRVSVALMRRLQCVALVGVSLCVVDAGARDEKNGSSVQLTVAVGATNKNIATLNVDRLDAGIDAIIPGYVTMGGWATGVAGGFV